MAAEVQRVRSVEAEEMTFKIVALIIIALLLVTDYAMLVVASRADERAERMYRRWESERGNSTPDK